MSLLVWLQHVADRRLRGHRQPVVARNHGCVTCRLYVQQQVLMPFGRNRPGRPDSQKMAIPCPPVRGEGTGHRTAAAAAIDECRMKMDLQQNWKALLVDSSL